MIKVSDMTERQERMIENERKDAAREATIRNAKNCYKTVQTLT